MTASPASAAGLLLELAAGKADPVIEQRLKSISQLAKPKNASLQLAEVLLRLKSPKVAGPWWAETGLASFDPDRFFLNLSRLAETEEGPEILDDCLGQSNLTDRLVWLLSGSQFLTDACLQRPPLLNQSLRPSFLDPPDRLAPLDEQIASAIPDDCAPELWSESLADFKLRETLRITLADLGQVWSTPDVLQRISDLAIAIIRRALDLIFADLTRIHGSPTHQDPEMKGLPPEFCVLGMGKLGGRELNYSSDIDLIYLFVTENGHTRSDETKPDNTLAHPEFYAKLARNLTTLLSGTSEHGSIYRVDLGLRPGGQSGAVAISLRGAENYYEYWGETWERLAMIKAHPIASTATLQKQQLGEFFLEQIKPFVWRRSLDYNEIEQLRQTKRRLEKSVQAQSGEVTNVKLSPGGIREIEFIVQAFQLIYGGKNPDLRKKSTIEMINTLSANNLLPEQDADQLLEAYLFLRTLENRIQLLENRQTHTLPASIKELAALARKMNLGGKNKDESAKLLMSAYQKHCALVRQIFDQMFPESEQDQASDIGSHDTDQDEVDIEGDDLNIIERLQVHGFSDPKRSAKTLKSLREGHKMATATSKQRFSQIAEALIRTAGQLPDPDRALDNLESFVRTTGSREALFATMSDSPEWASALLAVLGGSEYLSSVLLAQPDFIESVFRPEFLNRSKDRHELTAEFDQMLTMISHRDDKLMELRRIKRAEELRIGLRILLNQIDISQTMTELTNLAQVVVDFSYRMARNIILEPENLEQPNAFPFAVFGLGSLGSGELVFNSDLDLMFFYRDNDDDLDQSRRVSLAARLAQQISSNLSANLSNGFAYRIDLRLRPEGEYGPIAVNAESFDRYLENRASWWESQSLLRMMPLAGDQGLIDQVITSAKHHLTKRELTAAAAKEIIKMRQRMVTELAKPEGRFIDLKFGNGGILDVEFAGQMMLLAHSDRYAELPERRQSTMVSLEWLKTEGLLDEAIASDLMEGFLFQKRLENQIRLTYERPRSHLDQQEDNLYLLARLTGYSENQKGDELLTDLLAVRQRVRSAYQCVVEIVTGEKLFSTNV